MEAEKARAEAWYRHHQLLIERDTSWVATSVTASTGFATSGMKALLLANGGAAVALLAFLGNVWQSNRANLHELVIAIQPAMVAFVVGTSLAIFTAGMSYLTQLFFTNRKNKIGVPLQIVAILSGLGSLAAFSWGAIEAAAAFKIVPQ